MSERAIARGAILKRGWSLMAYAPFFHVDQMAVTLSAASFLLPS